MSINLNFWVCIEANFFAKILLLNSRIDFKILLSSNSLAEEIVFHENIYSKTPY